MHKCLKIARREYNAQVRTKGFIIGLAIAPVLACGGLIAFLLLKDHVDVTDKRVAVIDRSGLLAEHIAAEAQGRNAQSVFDKETGKKVRPAYVVEIVPPDDETPDEQALAFSERVRNKQLFAYVEIGKSVLDPEADPEGGRIRFHSESPLNEEVRNWIFWPINNRLIEMRAANSGLDRELVDRVTRRISVESLGLVSIDEATGAIKGASRTNELEAVFVPMGLMMLIFMMMMMGAMPLMGSVLEEKSQRIAEVLLGSIRPFGLMMGKLLGGVAVSVTSVLVYIAAGYIVADQMDATNFIPFHVLPWFFIFMVSAILMFGALLAAVGAACNEQSEAQSLMPFVMLPMLLPMFVWFMVVREPGSAFSTILPLVPPCTPLLMTVRLATPAGVPGWQLAAGLAGVILFTVFCVWAGGRIFRVGILLQGQPPRIRQLARWVFKG